MKSKKKVIEEKKSEKAKKQQEQTFEVEKGLKEFQEAKEKLLVSKYFNILSPKPKDAIEAKKGKPSETKKK